MMKVNDEVVMLILQFFSYFANIRFYGVYFIDMPNGLNNGQECFFGEIVNLRAWYLLLNTPYDGTCEHNIANRTKADN